MTFDSRPNFAKEMIARQTSCILVHTPSKTPINELRTTKQYVFRQVQLSF